MESEIFEELNNRAIDILRGGGVGVIPTDTIYGIVGSALDKQVVEEIFEIKERDRSKPMIVLIDSKEKVEDFGIEVTDRLNFLMDRVWPAPISLIIPCNSSEFEFLHRGHKSIAFRVPEPRWLRSFLGKTGPLVAPSANISSKPPAETVEEVRDYFGNSVDFYVDQGKQKGESSVLIEVKRF